MEIILSLGLPNIILYKTVVVSFVIILNLTVNICIIFSKINLSAANIFIRGVLFKTMETNISNIDLSFAPTDFEQVQPLPTITMNLS